MAYCTADEVKVILKGVYDQVGEYNIDDESVTTDEQIDDAIADADSQLNAAIRRRGYATPLPDPVPDIIHQLSKNIASYLVDLLVRGQQRYEGDSYPFRLRYERARETLRKIETSFVDLYDLGTGPPISDTNSVLINAESLFTERDVFPRGIPSSADNGELSERRYYENIPRFPWGN